MTTRARGMQRESGRRRVGGRMGSVIESMPPELVMQTRAAIDVWTAADDVALGELCDCLRPLLFQFFVTETRDRELAADLLEQTMTRVRFGAFAHRNDVIGWTLEIAQRLLGSAIMRAART